VNLLDILLVIVIGASIVTGFMAGFARVGIGFLATICGLLFGFWFYGIPAEWLHRHFKSVALSNLMGFLVVFIACLFVGSLIGHILSKLFKWTGLSWLDRLLGGAFGFVRGALMAVAFVAVLLAFTPKPLPNWMVDSTILPYAINASDVCADLAPNAIKDAFRESMHDIRTLWEQQLKKKKRKSDLKEVES
jgi:membrane protein required for colicin V production